MMNVVVTAAAAAAAALRRRRLTCLRFGLSSPDIVHDSQLSGQFPDGNIIT